MADEANKEQAEECARRGIEALNNGDAATAVRLLTKSLRMYNLGDPVQSKLNLAKRILEGNNTNDNDSTTSSPRTTTDSPRTNSSSSASGHDGVRHRHVHSSSSSSSSSSSQPNPVLRPHTPEMAELVRKIKNAKTYYDVLGVNNDADEDTIKKAYKKLALKIHPDKNTAPGSDEAFKRVGAACAVLTDQDKRAAYDRYGEAGADGISTNTSSDRDQARARYYRQHFEEEISPEDIFNMFFSGGLGGGFGGGMTQIYRDEDGNLRAVRSGGRNTHRHEYGHNGNNNNGKAFQLLQLIPLIIFFLFSFLSFGGWDDRFFSLGRTDTFSILRKTTNPNGLTYYVRPDIDKRLRRDKEGNLLRTIESEVLRDWMKSCRHDTRGESCEVLMNHLYSPHATSDPRNRHQTKPSEEDEFQTI